jgi:hypothetical protein
MGRVQAGADVQSADVGQDPANGTAAEAENNPADELTIAKAATRKSKRSTERGEGRAKLIASLTKHHRYADGDIVNSEPIGNNELARLAKVSESTASAFFTKEFGGHTKYQAVCLDEMRLVTSLKLLNQEFSPWLLFGKRPPDEGDRRKES